MWFNPIEDLNSSNISNPKTLIGRNHLLINTYEFNLSFRSDGKLWFNVNSQGPGSSGGIVKSDINNWSKNQWYYLVAVIDPIDGMSLYIDGVKQSMTIPAETSALGALPYITTLGTWGDEYVRNYGGKMDEVRLWSRALDSIEIAQKICALPNPGSAIGLVAYYKMNEGSGTSVTDSSSMSYTGAVSGAIWVIDSACLVPGPKPNGLEDLNKKTNLNIYPNPAASELYLSIDGRDNRISEVRITDIRGSHIKQIQFQPGEDPSIWVANLPNGPYFLVAKTLNNETYRGRFIVQH